MMTMPLYQKVHPPESDAELPLPPLFRMMLPDPTTLLHFVAIGSERVKGRSESLE